LRAFITGISGFVGGHLAEYLLSHTDWEVYGLSRHRPQEAWVESIGFFQEDALDYHALRAVLEEVKPHYIFHLAAQSFVPLSWADPWGVFENNVRAQLNLLQAVVELELPSRILVVGSNEEYGIVSPDELPIRETHPLRPATPYAVSKVAQDLLGLQYHLHHGLETVRVRPFNHIGPRQSERFVASSLAKQIAEIEAGLRPPVIKVGNLEARRDFTDVRDVVRAYHLVLTRGEVGEVYNVGSGVAHSIRELLDVLLSLSKARVQVKVDPELLRPLDTPVSFCDFSRLRQATGWEPTIPFERSLEDILNYWRRRANLIP